MFRNLISIPIAVILRLGRRIQFLIVALISFLLFNSPLFAECQWVDTEGEAPAENLTPSDAKQLALNLARISAIKEVVGIEVISIDIVKNLAFLTDIVKTFSQGYIVKEEPVEWKAKVYQEKKESFPSITFMVRLRACVSGSGERDPYFKVRANLNKIIFTEREDAELTIWSEQDGYINVFNWTADDKVDIVDRDGYLTSIPIKARTEIKYPPTDIASLKMKMTSQKKHDSEYFIIVVTKKPFDFAGFLGREKDIPLTDFYNALLSIPSKERAESYLPYMVVASQQT